MATPSDTAEPQEDGKDDYYDGEDEVGPAEYPRYGGVVLRVPRLWAKVEVVNKA